MELQFDALLNRIFNNPQTLWANVIFGILILMLGSIFIKKESSKGKKTAGLLCLLIGSFTILSSVLQLFFPLF